MGGVEIPTTTAAVTAATKSGSVVVNISATWCEPCAHLNTVFAELAAQHAALRFVQIDADELPEVCEQYSVESVPAFLFLHADYCCHGDLDLSSKFYAFVRFGAD